MLEWIYLLQKQDIFCAFLRIYFWIYFQNAYVIVGFDGLLVVISFI